MPSNKRTQIQNPITVIKISNHRVDMVHHTQDLPIIRTNLHITLITHIQTNLDHNHLTIREMEIVHDDHPHKIGFAM